MNKYRIYFKDYSSKDIRRQFVKSGTDAKNALDECVRDYPDYFKTKMNVYVVRDDDDFAGTLAIFEIAPATVQIHRIA